MKLKRYTNKLYCFSPPVMLATFLLEFVFLFYTIWRYKMDTVSRLVVTTLACLGIFQLAEYMVCGGLGLTTFEWSRLGYITITLLPAIGIHLVSAIAGKKSTALITTAYGSAALFATYFILVPDAINSHQCRANYAVFNMDHVSNIVYALYYYGWLLVAIYLAWRWAKTVPKRTSALYSMVIGLGLFIAPTTAFNLIDSSTIAGIPSIMCGFAVLLAIVLVVRVLPAVSLEKHPGKYSWRLWQQ